MTTRSWRFVRGAVSHSILLTVLGYAFILAGLKYRSGKPIELDILPLLAIVGALAGGFRAWRVCRSPALAAAPDDGVAEPARPDTTADQVR